MKKKSKKPKPIYPIKQALAVAKQKAKKSEKKKIIKKKAYCPVCGSTLIKQVNKQFYCLDCKSLFLKPKRTKIKLSKKPKYIG